jgi:hypothetical protein
MPCDAASEKTLASTASQFAAGSITNVRSDRSVQTHRLGHGSPWHLEIEREMGTSVREAIARMRRQRASVENLQESQVNQTFNVHGPNARVNISSTDNSTNVVNEGVPFSELRRAIEAGISNEAERITVLERLGELKASTDKKSALEKYLAFVGAVADHITLLGPFLPAIGHWVHNLAESAT